MADNIAVTAGSGTTVHADEYTHSTLGSGKTQLVKLVDGTLDSGTAIAAGGGVEAGALRVTVASDSTGVLSVDDNGSSLTIDNAGITTIAGAVSGTEMQVDVVGALPAGTNAIGKLAANSGVDIGDVDITSIAAGDNNIGNVDIVSGTVTTVSTLTGGGVAHDSADSGNPHKIGMIAYSPDGTTPGTAVAELDRTNAKADLDGRLFVNNVHPRMWSFHSDGSSALTDTSVQADPGDGFQIVVTSIIFSTGAATACNIFFEEGASKVLGPWYLEAVAGRGLIWTGVKPITASTALTVTTSAAIAQSLDVCGYIQAV